MKRNCVVVMAAALTLSGGVASAQGLSGPTTTMPKVASMPDPDDYYPAQSKTLGETGLVRLRACYGVNGRVIDVVVLESSGFIRLDDAALLLGPRVRVKPGTQDGTLMPGCIDVPVRFKASEPSPNPAA